MMIELNDIAKAEINYIIQMMLDTEGEINESDMYQCSVLDIWQALEAAYLAGMVDHEKQ